MKINIPSPWNAVLDPDEPTPYGYGSYRLTIMVDEKERVYSIQVPSIRSASEFYVNGRRLAASGQTGSSAEAYRPENLPYIASFMPDAEGKIEVVIQAANYSDPRSGGLVRSLKFGADYNILREKQLSQAMQYLIAAALMMQAAYLIMFFAIERRRLWLFSALALSSYTVVILNSSEDKLLHQWFPISYAGGYMILCTAFTVMGYSLLRMVSERLPAAWRLPVERVYGVLAVIGIAASLTFPPQASQKLQFIIFGCMLPVAVLLILSIMRSAANGIRGSMAQFLGYLALGNHMAWWSVLLFTGTKLIYYPFDLMLAMLFFSSIWIRRYYVLYTEQRALTAKLEEVNRQKDRFLANTSHELRNPLHGMMSMSQVVLNRERQTLSADSVHLMETVAKVGRRMSLMLEDLIDVVRLRDSSVRLQQSGVALQPVVEGVLDMIRTMSDGKPIALRNEVTESFPLVAADENRLIQIMFNLLHNAVKFTMQGEIVVDARIEQGCAIVSVTDSGIGMDKETLGRIFEPYEQGGDDVAYEGGFGLGLSICKQLVELHGGSIHARSQRGEGSCFYFSLPLADSASLMESAGASRMQQKGGDRSVPEASDASEHAHPGRPASFPPLALDEAAVSGELLARDRPRVLAVDDDALNLQVLASLLPPAEYSITAVTNGAAALARLQEQAWDLVITDVMMPQMSGYELTRRIRERYTVSELPVLVLTARTRPEDIENGFMVGANDYVTKPVEGRELRARVQALTHLASSSRERVRMEAAWLQAQIEPHFFLNTLNSIAALQMIDSERMIDLIMHFGDYLREKFKFQNAGELVELGDELRLVRAYLFIEQTRFADSLEVAWELDEGLEKLRIPPYSVQPLVENAIRHGLTKRRGRGIVTITLLRRADQVEIAVRDNGVGMTAEEVEGLLQAKEGQGIALRNINQRLQRLYGSGLQIASTPGQGTVVSFHVVHKQDSADVV
ncbi:ATP-binding protein [Paenibacillus sp. 598K]|uniref:ATP-binding protein n=1 Tax=Paenibacillus sp. 598K TaxID=1117987 RepID=UPI00162A1739|nr:ATP-binding protein [Paenibacillus sp. 598K]